MLKNKPYVKHIEIIDDEKIVTNPITDELPYISEYPSRRLRRQRQPRPHSNKKGVQLVITKVNPIQLSPGKTLPPYFAKVMRRLQFISGKYIVKATKKASVKPVFKKPRVVTHNVYVDNQNDTTQ